MPITVGGTQITFNDGTTQNTAASVAANQQIFDASGTWTKPSSGTMARIQVWGGGAGGNRSNVYGLAGGGGGGGYNEVTVPLSSLASSVSVTVGAGGIGRTGSTGVGTAGGSSSFGSVVSAGGGSSGSFATEAGHGGGPNGSASSTLPGAPLLMLGTFVINSGGGTLATLYQGLGVRSWGSGCYATTNPAVFGTYHGGGGGTSSSGGSSIWGGGGGANSGTTGISVYGGNGGNNSAGVAPGGGGGANPAVNGNGYNGAAGRVIVTVW